MSDLFAAYAKRATTTAPARLVGPMPTRAEARRRYTEIVAELSACSSPSQVRDVQSRHAAAITQYAAELEFFWIGDDDFLGLEREIEWATARVDDRLDMPRWDSAGYYKPEQGTEDE